MEKVDLFDYMASSKFKGKSYWRTRRDVLCSVDGVGYNPSGTEPFTNLLYPERSPENIHEGVDCSSEQDDDVLSDTTDIYGDSESDAYLSCNEFETSDSVPESILNDENLPNLLAKWATQFNISLAAFGNLLHLLHQYHPFLPLDARTLLCTPRQVTIKPFLSGGTIIILVSNSTSRNIHLNCQQMHVLVEMI